MNQLQQDIQSIAAALAAVRAPAMPGEYDLHAEVSAALKARIGVKPANVVVHPDGGLNTRSEHKARRIIDERKLDYSI